MSVVQLKHKYTLWFSIISLSVLLLGILAIYQVVRSAERRTYIAELQLRNSRIAERVWKTGSAGRLPDNITIRETDPAPQKEASVVSNHVQPNPALQAEGQTIQLNSQYLINGRHYEIRSCLPVIGASMGLLYPILSVSAWLLLFFSVLVFLFSEVISWYILSPFKAALRFIGQFEADHSLRMDSEPTSTLEFKTLNDKLRIMTDKVRHDIDDLHDFSQYGTHELKTPADIIRIKVEELMQYDLGDVQEELLADIQIQATELTSMNASLLFLARLIGGGFQDKENIPFGREVKKNLDKFRFWIERKKIALKDNDIDEDLVLEFHSLLVSHLLNNIFSNSIRHNREGGDIEVVLDHSGLIVRNTICPLSEQSEAEKGIPNKGRRIIQRICDVSDIRLLYFEEAGWYTTELQFKGKAYTA